MGARATRLSSIVSFSTIILALTCSNLIPAHASQNFLFAGKTMDCDNAFRYRDTQLFEGFASVYDNYDAKKQERLDATLQEFRTAAKDIAKTWDQADVLFRKKVAVTWGGLLVGKIAEKSKIGVKASLSVLEKRAVDTVVARGVEWSKVFSQYGITGEADVKDLVAIDVSPENDSTSKLE